MQEHHNKQAICAYIIDFWQKNNYGPTLREIRDSLEISSISTVHAHVHRLARDGYLSIQRDHARSVRPTEKLLRSGTPMPIAKVTIPDDAARINPDTFHYTLSRLRREKHLTRLDLARLADLSYNTVCLHEGGKALPNSASMRKYCLALQVPITALFCQDCA